MRNLTNINLRLKKNVIWKLHYSTFLFFTEMMNSGIAGNEPVDTATRKPVNSEEVDKRITKPITDEVTLLRFIILESGQRN